MGVNYYDEYMQAYVCLFVCSSVCPLAYFRNHKQHLTKYFMDVACGRDSGLV